MQSKLNRKQTDDPHDFVVIRSDDVRVAPSDEEISDLLRTAARQHADSQAAGGVGSPVPPVDTTFRATDVNHDILKRRRSIGRRVMRAFAALLLAACVGGAAVAWQASGYAFKKAAVKWLPKFALSASLPLEQLGLVSPSTPPADEPAAAQAEPSQSASLAQPAPPSAEAQPAANAAQPADSPQTIQSMARDLASVGQEVEALKASIAELKASQQQMARDLAKANEQSARAKLSVAQPHPTVAPARKPAPPYASSPTAATPAYRPAATPYPAAQAAAVPPAPQAVQPTAPRPPMPVQ